ncbi:MAG: MBL fold metallo-hydrolase [Clostridia bacterium]|nr:MBL fold metallo-hydrolase [Clostridia bacterium]
MKIIHICPHSWGSNCYLLVSGGEAFVVDPSPSATAIIKMAADAGAEIRGILLTHGHFDHVISAETLHESTDAPVMIHRDDSDMLSDPEKNAYRTFFGQDRAFRPADRLLDNGELLTLGGEQIRVMHTPGHTRGSACFVTDNFIVTGDTLFAEGYGRVDLYGGDMNQMIASLKALAALPRELTIYPGHGASSTLDNALSLLGL